MGPAPHEVLTLAIIFNVILFYLDESSNTEHCDDCKKTVTKNSFYKNHFKVDGVC